MKANRIISFAILILLFISIAAIPDDNPLDNRSTFIDKHPGRRAVLGLRAGEAMSAAQKQRVQNAINAIKNGPPASITYSPSSK
jgi:hypothetical protein